MKKLIAKTLCLLMVLSFAIVYAPATLKVDVVSAATSETTTTTPVKTAPAAATIADGSQVYVVVSGDKMWKIAEKYNLTLDALKALNPQIKNFNLIYVGQKIVVGKVEAAPAAPAVPAVTVAKKLFHGFGESPNYRFLHDGILNITTASVVFDQDGKIVDLKWDVEEITPALFPGWANPADPQWTDKAAQAAFKAKIDDQWLTKYEELDEYGMKATAVSGKEWWEQMNFYENYFKGMTVAQVEAWVAKYTDANKRPYKMAYLETDKLTADAKAALKTATANFTAEEKAMLVDVTSGATMSLQDDHSHFITALKEAYEARTEIK